MEHIIAIVIGIFLLGSILHSKSFFMKLFSLAAFIFLLWIYRTEVSSITDRAGQFFHIENASLRFHYFLMNVWQRLTELFSGFTH